MTGTECLHRSGPRHPQLGAKQNSAPRGYSGHGCWVVGSPALACLRWPFAMVGDLLPGTGETRLRAAGARRTPRSQWNRGRTQTRVDARITGHPECPCGRIGKCRGVSSATFR